MKIYLMPITLIMLFTTSANAESELKINDIKTIEDVQEFRNNLINKMTNILNSNELSEERVTMIEKRIYKLSNKPLPTQEQIDWRIENPVDIKTMRERKEKLKRKIQKKILYQYFNNRQIVT